MTGKWISVLVSRMVREPDSLTPPPAQPSTDSLRVAGAIQEVLRLSRGQLFNSVLKT
ncbi:hypothetical protein ARUE_232p01240 (plasmid) [Arthrobacter sp. Rue61a]|nr:hypothetical protein ARUE_232p01240 [Arthrobacter sp. Rue61a]